MRPRTSSASSRGLRPPELEEVGLRFGGARPCPVASGGRPRGSRSTSIRGRRRAAGPDGEARGLIESSRRPSRTLDRHADANRAELTLRTTSDAVRGPVEVRDDGRGFDPAHRRWSGSGAGAGGDAGAGAHDRRPPRDRQRPRSRARAVRDSSALFARGGRTWLIGFESSWWTTTRCSGPGSRPSSRPTDAWRSSVRRRRATRPSTSSAQLKPDVVVMDLSMPGSNGLEATRRIAALELGHEGPGPDGPRRGGVPGARRGGGSQRLPDQDERRHRPASRPSGRRPGSGVSAAEGDHPPAAALQGGAKSDDAAAGIHDLSTREQEVLALTAEGSQLPGDRQEALHQPEDRGHVPVPHHGQAGAEPPERAGAVRARGGVAQAGVRSSSGSVRRRVPLSVREQPVREVEELPEREGPPQESPLPLAVALTR